MIFNNQLVRKSKHNPPFDSLFLAEGFGALDEDAPETAIENLSSLQQKGGNC